MPKRRSIADALAAEAAARTASRERQLVKAAPAVRRGSSVATMQFNVRLPRQLVQAVQAAVVLRQGEGVTPHNLAGCVTEALQKWLAGAIPGEPRGARAVAVELRALADELDRQRPPRR